MGVSEYTIGQLAKRVGLSPSTLRYYEEQGLLEPPARTASGYRIYDQAAEQRLMFIQRAQRIGFSLADIRTFLKGVGRGDLLDETVVRIAESRFLDIERQLTDLRVLRHELELFLLDFRTQMRKAAAPAADLYERLVRQVCGESVHGAAPRASLEWLLKRTQCSLATLDSEAILSPLRGIHIHTWREGDAYHILVPSHDEAVRAALAEIARIEADCDAHASPRLTETEEGLLFIAGGDNAFLFAQFFLALEQERPPPA